jgi:hypothetical protein
MEAEKLASATQDELTLVMSFFPRVDVKASVLLAVDTGMLGYLATHLPTFNSVPWWELIAPGLAFVLLALSLLQLYKGAFPVLTGGHSSLVYFSEIATRTESKFINEFIEQRESEYVKDVLGQVWRNSEILKAKFAHVKLAFIFLAWSVLPWTVALADFALRTPGTPAGVGK